MYIYIMPQAFYIMPLAVLHVYMWPNHCVCKCKMDLREELLTVFTLRLHMQSCSSSVNSKGSMLIPD